MRLIAPATWPLAARIAAGIGVLALVLLLLLATLPLGWLRGTAESRLSAALGRSVRIGSVARLDAVSFAPRIALRDVRVAQPAWAGRGDMLRVRAVTFRLPLLPALLGKARIREVAVDGLRAALVRDASKRENWSTGDKAGSSDSGLDQVTLTDARVTLVDKARHLDLAATVTADARGIRVDATGHHRGRPARLTLVGAPARGRARWPFRAAFASPLAQLSLAGSADAPLAFDRFTARATAAGPDLASVDEIIEAGLPPTQPVTLAGNVRRDGDDWRLTNVTGRVGNSPVSGRFTVTRPNDRAHVAADVRFTRLDFDDLANDAQLARARAQRARTGPRVIPALRINLEKLAHTDFRIAVAAPRLVSRERSALRSLSGTFTLDRSRLVAEPLILGLDHGRLAGSATIDQRAGAPPRLALDLAVQGARLEDLIAARRVVGALHGRIVLAGRGDTVRSALARGNGRVNLWSRGGSLDRTVAEVLGRNAGAALGAVLGVGAARTPLRCLGVRFVARGGLLRPDIFTLDTGITRGEGSGTIRLSDERVALTFHGGSKDPGLARLPSPIQLTGTLSRPTVETGYAGPAKAKTILRTLGDAVGRVFDGKQERPATSVNCAALLASVR